MFGGSDFKPLRERASRTSASKVLSVNWGLTIAIAFAVSFWLLLAFVVYTTVD
jgi:ABC-type uncharacterized transport system permease subunit